MLVGALQRKPKCELQQQPFVQEDIVINPYLTQIHSKSAVLVQGETLWHGRRTAIGVWCLNM